MMRPIIGIPVARDLIGKEPQKLQMNYEYACAVETAGGMPLLLPVTPDVTEEIICQWLVVCGGILLPGGGDIAPVFYGESALPQLTCTNRAQDVTELLVCTMATSAGLPILGICKGMQTMNVAFGGTLWQDIAAQCKNTVCHDQSKLICGELFHPITVQQGTLLSHLMGGTRQESNTFHHQAVKELAPDFIACAHTPDGLVEAMENPACNLLAVQWNPEYLSAQYPQHAALFDWLVGAAQQRMNHR